MQTWVLFFLTVTGLVSGQSIKTPPVDSTGVVGEHAMFLCEVVFGRLEAMAWEFNKVIIYSIQDSQEHYPCCKDKYSVTRDGGNFILLIKNLDLTDAGEYACTTMVPSATAVLSVLGKPQLSTPNVSPVENSTATYTCTAQFVGHSKEGIVPPSLQVIFAGATLNAETNKEKCEGSSNCYKITQIHSITLDANMNGKVLMCNIGTSSPEGHVNTSTVVRVLYPVKTVIYIPIQQQYEVGTEINCTADGNPKPQYLWNDINTANSVEGQTLHVTEDILGDNNWRCTATNNINGNFHKKSVVAVFSAVLPLDNKKEVIASWKIGVGVTIPVCLLVAILAFLYHKRYKNKICDSHSIKTEWKSSSQELEKNSSKLFKDRCVSRAPGNGDSANPVVIDCQNTEPQASRNNHEIVDTKSNEKDDNVRSHIPKPQDPQSKGNKRQNMADVSVGYQDKPLPVTQGSMSKPEDSKHSYTQTSSKDKVDDFKVPNSIDSKSETSTRSSMSRSPHIKQTNKTDDKCERDASHNDHLSKDCSHGHHKSGLQNNAIVREKQFKQSQFQDSESKEPLLGKVIKKYNTRSIIAKFSKSTNMDLEEPNQPLLHGDTAKTFNVSKPRSLNNLLDLNQQENISTNQYKKVDYPSSNIQGWVKSNESTKSKSFESLDVPGNGQPDKNLQESNSNTRMGFADKTDIINVNECHWMLPREEGEYLLEKDGDYIIYESQTDLALFELAVMLDKNVERHNLGYNSVQRTWILNNKQEYKTIAALVSALSRRPIRIAAVGLQEWELYTDDVVLKRDQEHGTHREIYNGRYNNNNVTIFKCKESLLEDPRVAFFHGGRLLRKYSHKNIAKFIGITITKKPFMMVLEHECGGDLLHFLQTNGPSLSFEQMVRMCDHILDGMVYLKTQPCIHRDLAARNCLVGENNIAKIFNFSMAVEGKTFQADVNKPISGVRWASPETLKCGTYTFSSDIWSFGVLMWEIFSHGATPYEDIPITKEEIITGLDKGNRLTKPEKATQALYNLMSVCWEKHPQERHVVEYLHRKVKKLYKTVS